MRRIKTKKHKIGTYKVSKISLLCFDDKGVILDYGIHTLAYFHKDLRKQILTDDHKDEDKEDDKEEETLTNKKDSKRFSQKEDILTDDQRFTQFKISAYK